MKHLLPYLLLIALSTPVNAEPYTMLFEGLLNILNLDSTHESNPKESGELVSQKRICKFPSNGTLASDTNKVMEVEECKNKGGVPMTW